MERDDTMHKIYRNTLYRFVFFFFFVLKICFNSTADNCLLNPVNTQVYVLIPNVSTIKQTLAIANHHYTSAMVVSYTETKERHGVSDHNIPSCIPKWCVYDRNKNSPTEPSK